MAISSVQIVVNYTNGGLPITGLSPIIKIREVGTGSIVIPAGNMIDIGDGFYKYLFTTFDTNKTYVYVVDGGNTLTDDIRYSYGGNDNFIQETAEAVVEEINSGVPYASFN